MQFKNDSILKLSLYYFRKNSEGKLKSQPTLTTTNQIYELFDDGIRSFLKKLLEGGNFKMFGVDINHEEPIYKLYIDWSSDTLCQIQNYKIPVSGVKSRGCAINLNYGTPSFHAFCHRFKTDADIKKNASDSF